MAIDVFVADEQDDHPVDARCWADLARSVLVAQGVRGEAELSVIYVDEATIASHNEQFLHHQGPTDVLSFPIEDDPIASGRAPDSGGPGPVGREHSDPAPTLLGDILICPAVAMRNAPEHAGTYEEELALLLVHGILHLLGMDHEVDAEAERMEAREQELLNTYFRDGVESTSE